MSLATTENHGENHPVHQAEFADAVHQDRFADAVHQAGFADPVHHAQQCFRVLLAALSRPCLLQTLPAHLPEAPPPLSPGMAAALLTLCDGDTPVWLAPAYDTPAVRAWLRFHTACPLAGHPGEARFAAAPCFAALPPLSSFAQGLPAFPDQSATLLVGIPEVSGVAVPGGASFSASGPGIQEKAALALVPGALPTNFDRIWAANAASYPLGVDMFLLAPTAVIGLPRTTKLTPLSQSL